MAAEFELPETPENPESRKERRVGLIIAAIAVVLAIVSHLGNEIQKDEVLAHIDASDAYNDYQAKKMTNLLIGLTEDTLAVNYPQLWPGDQALADQEKAAYAQAKKENAEKGEKHRLEGDERVKEAALLARKAAVVDVGEIALQISIVMCSLTILTEQSLFVRIGMALALLGAVIAAWGILLMG